MERPVQAGILSGLIGQQPVLVEGPLRVLARGLVGDVHPLLEMVRNRSLVPVQTGDDLHRPLVGEGAAVSLGLQELGDLGRREVGQGRWRYRRPSSRFPTWSRR